MVARELSPEEGIAVITSVLAGAGPTTRAIGGTIGFRVQGAGDWVVDLGAAGGRWSKPTDPTVVERCDVALYAYPEALSNLILHPERVELDIKSGTLEVDGDRTKLVRLGRMLKGRGSILSHRVKSDPNSN